MMTDWYQKSINALTLNGKAERTQEAYTRAVRMLSEFYGKRPDEISEGELEDYFLHRRNVDRWSGNTLRICYCGIRFFFVQVLQRNWRLFEFLRAKSEARLPRGVEPRGSARAARVRAHASQLRPCCARIGEHTATRGCSFLPAGATRARPQAPPPRWPRAACRAPFAKPSRQPASPSARSRSTRCVTMPSVGLCRVRWHAVSGWCRDWLLALGIVFPSYSALRKANSWSSGR